MFGLVGWSRRSIRDFNQVAVLGTHAVRNEGEVSRTKDRCKSDGQQRREPSRYSAKGPT